MSNDGGRLRCLLVTGIYFRERRVPSKTPPPQSVAADPATHKEPEFVPDV